MSDDDHAPSFYPVQHNRSGGSAFRLACDGALKFGRPAQRLTVRIKLIVSSV
jgi:hypothetical protein